MASVSSKEVELLKKSRLTFGERAHLTWKRMKDNKVNYFLILPFLIFFLLFTIIPVLSSIVLSFTRYDILNAPVFVGWDNYLRMFLEDEVFLIALKNTFQFAVITGPVSYFLCFVFAWFINDLPPIARATFTVIFYAPTLANIYFIFQYIQRRYVWTFKFVFASVRTYKRTYSVADEYRLYAEYRYFRSVVVQLGYRISGVCRRSSEP